MLAPTALADLHHLGQAQPRRRQGRLSERRHPRRRYPARRARPAPSSSASPSPAEPARASSPSRHGADGRAHRCHRVHRPASGDRACGRRVSCPGARPARRSRPGGALGVELHFGDLTSELERFVAGSEVVDPRRRRRSRASTPLDFHAVNARGSARLAAATPEPAACSSRSPRWPPDCPRSRPTPPARPRASGWCWPSRPAARDRGAAAGRVRPRRPADPADVSRHDARLAAPSGAAGMRAFRYSTPTIWSQLVRALLADPPPGGTIIEPDDGSARRLWLGAILRGSPRRSWGARCGWSRCRARPCRGRHGWPSSTGRCTRPAADPVARQGRGALPSRLGERYARHGGGARLAAAGRGSATGWRPLWLGTARRAGCSAAATP